MLAARPEPRHRVGGRRADDDCETIVVETAMISEFLRPARPSRRWSAGRWERVGFARPPDGRLCEQILLRLDRRHRDPVERQQQEAEIEHDEENASDAAGAPHRMPRTTPVAPVLVPDPGPRSCYSSTGFSRRRTSQNEMTVSMIVNIHAPAVPWPRWKNWKPCW